MNEAVLGIFVFETKNTSCMNQEKTMVYEYEICRYINWLPTQNLMYRHIQPIHEDFKIFKGTYTTVYWNKIDNFSFKIRMTSKLTTPNTKTKQYMIAPNLVISPSFTSSYTFFTDMQSSLSPTEIIIKLWAYNILDYLFSSLLAIWKIGFR